MTELSPKKTARIAGILYLVIIVSGIVAEFGIRSNLIVPGDAAATASRMMASESLFRFSTASDFVMIASDVALALFFYLLFKSVSHTLSLLAAFFRLIQAAILGMNLLNLFIALNVLKGTFVSALGGEQSYALASLFLDAHATGYSIALVFFGIQCFVLGYLILKSGFLPRVLGILMIFASLGYLVDSFANFLLPSYDNFETIFALVVFLPAFIGELSLGLWLLIKGVDNNKVSAIPVS